MRTAVKTLLFLGTASMVGAGSSLVLTDLREGRSISLPFDLAALTPFGSLLPARSNLPQAGGSEPDRVILKGEDAMVVNSRGQGNSPSAAAMEPLIPSSGEDPEVEPLPFTRLAANFSEIAADAMIRIGYVPKGMTVAHVDAQTQLQAAFRTIRLVPEDLLVTDSATLLAPGSAFRLHGVASPGVEDLCIGDGGTSFSCRDWATEGLRLLVSQSLSVRCTPVPIPETPFALDRQPVVPTDLAAPSVVWGHVEGGDLASFAEALPPAADESGMALAEDAHSDDDDLLALLNETPGATLARCSANLGGEWIDLSEWTVSMGLNRAGDDILPIESPDVVDLRQLEMTAAAGTFGLWGAGWRKAEAEGLDPAPGAIDPDPHAIRSGQPI